MSIAALPLPLATRPVELAAPASGAPVGLLGVQAAVAGLDARALVAAGPVGEVVRALDRVIAQVQAVRLAVVAAADRAEVAAESGAANTAAWLAGSTRSDGAAAAAVVKLATALESELPVTRAALAAGEMSTEHAAVIATAASRLPDGLDPGERARIERGLVAAAKRVDPARLRKHARRALVLADRTAAEVDAHEDQQLRSDEERAYMRSRLRLHDNGDGTTSGSFVVPTLAAAILRKTVQQIASPRRVSQRAAAHGATTAAKQRAVFEPIDWAQRYGQALVELLEHLPTERLHGKVAATVVVSMNLDELQSGLRAAHADTGTDLSAGDARRLACNAGLVPVVLGGESIPLDLGRTQRFFTEHHQVALAKVYDACAATGCDRPYAWCELHHEDPWHQGGATDLHLAVPLCAWHHRRIHDPRYDHAIHTHPSGRKHVDFTRRT